METTEDTSMAILAMTAETVYEEILEGWVNKEEFKAWVESQKRADRWGAPREGY